MRWGYFRTRKQFLLSRFPDPWRIFFAQPPAMGGDDPWRPRREGNVTFFTVPFLKPGTTSGLYNLAMRSPFVRGVNERVAERFLSSQLRRLGVDPEPVVMTSNIYCARALSRLPRKLLFYDFNDSPFQFSGVPAWAEPYWRRTLEQVDVFFVVSEHYRRWLAAQTSRPLVTIGNGVEVERFETAMPEPADLADCPRPRIGYVGLMSHFLDFETLAALRESRRAGTLILIGPRSSATNQAVDQLASAQGVRVLGPRPYEQVPAYMQALDVGVIPFRANDAHVQGINPNKVYQYLSAGIPVVTTPVLDLAPSAPFLQFASNPTEMRSAVERALDAPRDAEACRALARPHDWGVLARRMVDEMERRLAAAA